MPNRRLIIGCGYLGMRVAEIWQAESSPVFALTRSTDRANEFKGRGWIPLLGDLCGGLPAWPDVDTALISVGFDRQAGYPIEQVYVEGVERLINDLPDSTKRVIYISSTGVYGAAVGEWLDEASPCAPDRPGGAACLAAEQKLSQSRFADRLIVLRLAGIYGPGRIPRIQMLAQGDAIDADPDGFLNLIHVEDAAQVVGLAEHYGPSGLFCVSDGAPCMRRDFLKLAAKEMGLPEPTFRTRHAPDSPTGERQTEPSPRNRRTSNKRIRNDHMLEMLKPTLQFPSYRQGLPHAVRNSQK